MQLKGICNQVTLSDALFSSNNLLKDNNSVNKTNVIFCDNFHTTHVHTHTINCGSFQKIIIIIVIIIIIIIFNTTYFIQC